VKKQILLLVLAVLCVLIAQPASAGFYQQNNTYVWAGVNYSDNAVGRGVVVQPTTNITLMNATMPWGSSPTTCNLMNGGSTIIMNGTVSSNVVTFNYNLTGGTQYRIECHSNGAAYNSAYNNSGMSFPRTNQFLTFVTGSYAKANNTNNLMFESMVINALNETTPPLQTITATLINAVNGTTWTNNTYFYNVTGALTFTYFNITNAGFCVTYTGNGTGTNCTAGSGTSTYFNVTNTTTITGTQSITATTYQALLNISAYRLFLNTSIPTFNATLGSTTNATTTSTAFLKALNGTNNIQVAVAGNYTKNITCTVPAPFQTVSCSATGIHDNWYRFNATDVWNNIAIQNFTLIISNDTLGGVLYNQNTSNGSINISLLQGYTYNVQFSNPNSTYEFENATLAANASNQRYTFSVLPAPSIDITIRDADDNTIILENVTIQLINNATGQTNYTTTGGFFTNPIALGTYTIKLESTNYSQSTYTVTVNAGSVYYLTAYLQFAPETVVMQYVDSISSSVVLPNTAVSQERIVSGSWQVISSKVTDITGRTSFRYAEDVAYRFTAIKTGYQDKVFTLDPILFSSYTINMERDTGLDFDEDFQSVYLGYNPQLFYDAQENQVNITFSSPLGTFTSYNYAIAYPGGTKNGTGTNAVGQTFSVDFNITGSTIMDRVNITLTYDTSIGPARSFNYSNNIILNNTGQTFSDNQDNTYGVGLLERLIVGTIIIVIISGLITIGAGPLWGVGLGLFIMGVWVKIGFWPWWAAGLSFLVGFALLAGRTD